MQALSFHLGLQLPSAIYLCSSCPSPFCLSALALLHNVVQIMISYAGQGHLFSKGESLGTQHWHPSRQHFGLFRAHSGRWAEVCIFS